MKKKDIFHFTVQLLPALSPVYHIYSAKLSEGFSLCEFL